MKTYEIRLQDGTTYEVDGYLTPIIEGRYEIAKEFKDGQFSELVAIIPESAFIRVVDKFDHRSDAYNYMNPEHLKTDNKYVSVESFNNYIYDMEVSLKDIDEKLKEVQDEHKSSKSAMFEVIDSNVKNLNDRMDALKSLMDKRFELINKTK